MPGSSCMHPTVTENMSAACLYAVLHVLYACHAFVCAGPSLDNAHLLIFTCSMS